MEKEKNNNNMEREVEIVPAILPKSFADLEDRLALVSDLVPFVQVDVMDGRFTADRTWPYKTSNDPNFEAIIKEEIGFPFWDALDYEADLMVMEPEKVVEDWVLAGAARIIVHIESTQKLDEILKKLEGRVEIGLAINIDTPNEALAPYIDRVSVVQFMGIAKIGYQGNPFDERVIEKIKDFRSKFSDAIISVDGGVSLETGKKLIDAGVDRLVVGSAIFGSDNIVETLEQFKNL